MQPIIIIGTQRSGSNLLRLMLNQHSQITAPHPPHILQTFMPLLPLYGSLEKKQNFYTLVKDVCDFVNLNPVKWSVEMDADVIAAKSKTHSLIDIYEAIYATYSLAEQSNFWCCKSMANLYYIPEIEQVGLKPYYIHLIRDGRDVAASFRKAIVGEKHCYHLAKQWKQDQDAAQKNCNELAPDRYIPILYENLTSDPEAELCNLLNRIGLDFESSMLEYYKTSEAQKTAEAGKMWDNVSKPIMEKNSNKFLSQLSEEDVLIFESIAGDTLENYGYKPYISRDKWITHFDEEQIAGFDAENKNMKQNAIKSIDPEGMKKRVGQDSLVREILSRKDAL